MTPPRRRHLGGVLGALVAALLTGCGTPVPAPVGPPGPTPVPGPSSEATSPVRPSSSPTPTPSPTPTTCRGSAVPERLSLADERGSAWAFAPVDGSAPVVVEGRVSGSPAWSTSKVLVVAAYLDAVADGRPDRVGATDRRRIEAALTRSDADAVTAVRDRIPGRPGAAMTAVLRSIGDRTTVAPDSYQGTMRWSLGEQVRFTSALAQGRVVSRAASEYLLDSMHPVRAQAWGLGTIGATSYKGGWLRRSSPTRQLGVVDGYAVAISTEQGRAVRQDDGDDAHVDRMNVLAKRLEQRLTWERRCR